MEVREIRAELKRLGQTQAALARYLGLTKGQVSELLSGKTRMLFETHQKIMTFLRIAHQLASPGVEEERAPYLHRRPLVSITLEEAKALRDGPKREKLPPEEYERIRRELHEIAAALKNAPVLTDMTDDEILGYDEMP